MITRLYLGSLLAGSVEWRMGRSQGAKSKLCMEITDLYRQGDEAVERMVMSKDQNLRRDGATTV